MADIARNRQASYKFNFLEKWEAGLQLQGSEVKSLRNGGVQLKDAFATVTGGEVWLHNMHIAPYAPASRENHEPERSRKLLLHRREIERLIGKTREKGLTVVPTRLYFSRGGAKGGERQAPREGPEGRPAPPVLLRRAGQGGDRAGPRQGRRRQAPGHQGTRDEARDGAVHP